MAITKEQVFQAATALLQEEGAVPTLMALRHRIGSGSLTTIQKYLTEWKEEQKRKRVERPELPAEFKTLWDSLGGEVWKGAREIAGREIEEIRATYAKEAEKGRKDVEFAEELIKQTQEELEKVNQTTQGLQNERDEAKASLAAALAVGEELRRTAERERESSESRFNELQGNINTLTLRVGEGDEKLRNQAVRLEELREALDHAVASKATLEQELEELQQILDSFDEERISLREEIVSLRSENKTLLETIARLERALGARDEEVRNG